MKVLVLYSLADASRPDRVPAEFALAQAAAGVAAAIPGAAIEGVDGTPREVLDVIARHTPDVVFNCAEAPLGRPDREPHVAALLEWLGVRFTGAGSECLALCRRKDRVNPLLAAAGLAVPRPGVFPCIVKPADEDGSFGVWTGSICENEDAIAQARAHLPGRVIVEEFLPGREFCVSLWGAGVPEHDSIGETIFGGGVRLRTYFGKWHLGYERRHTPFLYHTEIAPALRVEILAAARGAWRVVGARDYLSVDVRLDAVGRPHVLDVLDVNPNPEISPGAGLHRAVTEAGWEWPRFVQNVIAWAS